MVLYRPLIGHFRKSDGERVKNETQYKKLIQKIQAERKHCLRKAILRYHESTPSVVSEKKWNTKEDKGKSMMHAL